MFISAVFTENLHQFEILTLLQPMYITMVLLHVYIYWLFNAHGTEPLNQHNRASISYTACDRPKCTMLLPRFLLEDLFHYNRADGILVHPFGHWLCSSTFTFS